MFEIWLRIEKVIAVIVNDQGALVNELEKYNTVKYLSCGCSWDAQLFS